MICISIYCCSAFSAHETADTYTNNIFWLAILYVIICKYPFQNNFFPTLMPYIYPDNLYNYFLFLLQLLADKTANIFGNKAMLISYIGKLILFLIILCKIHGDSCNKTEVLTFFSLKCVIS